LLATSFACARAQSRICTLAACSSGFSLDIRLSPTRGPSPQLPPGHYRLDVVYDQQKTHCEFDMPEDDKAFAYSFCRQPDGDAQFEFDLHRNRGYFSIGRITPFDVLVAISRDGQEIAREQFFPVYEAHYPNGPECDPGPCMITQATMVITPPRVQN